MEHIPSINVNCSIELEDILITFPYCGADYADVTLVASCPDCSDDVFGYSEDDCKSEQYDNTFYSLPIGIYEFCVSHSDGCSMTIEVDLSKINDIDLSVEATCNDQGMVDIVTGLISGLEPIAYYWEGPNGFSSSDTELFDLEPGTYYISATDSNGCEFKDEVILEYCCFPINFCDYNVGEPTCIGAPNGSIELMPSGGIEPYTYMWEHDSSINSDIVQDLKSGIYQVTVIDDTGCSSSCEIEIQDAADGINYSLELIHTSCGLMNGKLIIDAIHPSGLDLEYSIDGGLSFQMENNFSGLSSGTYELLIKGSDGCEIGQEIYIDESSLLDAFIDARCNQGIGYLTAMVNEGDGPFSFQWELPDGSSSVAESLQNAEPGFYYLTVTDSNNCTMELEVEASDCCENSGFCNYQAYPPSCSNAADGSVELFPADGIGPYNFEWSHDASIASSEAFGLTAGMYSVTISDSNNCSSICEVEIPTSDQTIEFDVDLINTSCNLDNGSIEIIMQTTIGNDLQFSIDGGATFSNDLIFWNLTAGDYNIVVENELGCMSTQNVMIEKSDLLELSLTATCGTNGLVNIEAIIISGGNAVEVTWNGPSGFTSNDQNIYDVETGTYSLIAVDEFGCIFEDEITYDYCCDPSNFCNYETQVPSCVGLMNGSITMDPQGGEEPYIYTWSHDASANDSYINGLDAGLYSVTIEDAQGCSTSCDIEIEESAVELDLDLDFSEPNCGENNGVILLSPIGINQNDLTFSIDGGTTFSNETEYYNLEEGFYDIIIISDTGCEYSTNLELFNSESLSVTFASYCNVSGLVNIDPIVNSGNEPLEFNWDGPTGNFVTSEGLIDIPHGIYFVTVTDASGCTSEHTIEQESCCEVFGFCEYDVQHATCINAQDGQITITPSSGNGPYDYQWEHDPSLNSNQLTNIFAGEYNVTIQDTNGCSSSCSIIVESQEIVPSIDIFTTDPTCGTDNGIIEIIATSATGNSSFEYSIDGGTTFSSSTTFSSLPNGDYQVMVKEPNGCYAEQTIALSNSANIEFDFSQSCSAGYGAISSNLISAAEPVEYIWEGPDGFSSTEQNIQNLYSGNYLITITDVDGCQLINEFTIDCCETDNFCSYTMINPTCSYAINGAITIEPIGGIAPYQFGWDHDSDLTSNEAIGLETGTYAVTITDSNNCSSYCEITLEEEPKNISAEFNIQDASCGQENGQVSIIVLENSFDEVTDFQFSIDGGNDFTTSNTFSNLSAGDYNLIMVDPNECFYYDNFIIQNAGSLSATFDVDCGGSSNAYINTNIDGDSSNLSFEWEGPNDFSATEQNIQNLNSGIYILTITDAGGCEIINEFTIDCCDSDEFCNYTSANPSCSNAANGEILIEPNSGVAPYNYIWEHNSALSGNEATGLKFGSYAVTIIDANNCTAYCEIVLEEANQELSVEFDIQPTSCGQENGQVSITVVNNLNEELSGFQFSIDGENNLTSNATFTNLAAGEYSLIYTDPQGCLYNESFTIPNDGSLSSTFEVDCNGFGYSFITPNIDGGSENISFTWEGPNGFSTSESIPNNLSEGMYSVTITDGACQISESIEVSTCCETQSFCFYNARNTSCENATDGEIMMNPQGGIEPYSFTWSHDASLELGTASSLSPGLYTVTIEDAAACTSECTIQIQADNYEGFSIGLSSSCTDAEYAIFLETEGNNNSFSWSGPNGFTSSNDNLESLDEGQYQVTVTNENGCTATNEITLIGCCNTANFCNYNLTPPSCADNVKATIEMLPSGGVGPYQYGWSHDADLTESKAEELIPGLYHVTVGDSKGCESICQILVEGLESPRIVNVLEVDPTCGLENGSLEIFAQPTTDGDLESIQYSIDNGSTFSYDSYFGNLGEGDYLVVIKDEFGCEDIVSPQLVNSYNLESSYSLSYPNDLGTVDLLLENGTAPFEFQWSGPNGYTSTEQSPTSLEGGEYVVIISDATGCKIELEIEIESFSIASVDLCQYEVIQPTCDLQTSEISMNPIQGQGPYTYEWSHSSETGNLVTALDPGTYSVTVNDSSSNSSVCSFEIYEAERINIEEINIDILPCEGLGTAVIVLAQNNFNQSEVSYTVDGISYQSDNTFLNLLPGNYTAIVNYNDECYGTQDFEIVVQNELTVSYEVDCDANDQANVSLSLSGTEPFTFEWSQDDNLVSNEENPIGLVQGTYQLEVTDDKGCTVTIDVEIPKCCSNTDFCNFNISPITCAGNELAPAIVTFDPQGGSAPYTFNWSHDASLSGNELVTIEHGSYSVTITDNNGCQEICTFIIEQINSIQLNEIITEPATCDLANGSIYFDLVNNSGISFSINNGESFQSSPTFENLSAGDYNILVTNGECSEFISATVIAVDHLTLSLTYDCNSEGQIELIAMVSDDSLISSISWNGPQEITDNELQQIVETEGTYSIEITDVNGCTYIEEVTTISCCNTEGFCNYEYSNYACDGSANGTIIFFPEGGEEPYNYEWSHDVNNNTPIAENLDTGNYEITITDSNGCKSECTVIIEPSETESLSLFVDYQENVTYGEPFNVELIFNRAEEDIAYIDWSTNAILSCNNCINPEIIITDHTEFSVYIEDYLGCSTELSFKIYVNKDFKIYIPNSFNPEDRNEKNRYFSIYGDEEHIESIDDFIIFDRWGSTIFQNEEMILNDPMSGWDGMLHEKIAESGTYVYMFVVSYKDGSEENFTGSITLIR